LYGPQRPELRADSLREQGCTDQSVGIDYFQLNGGWTLRGIYFCLF